MNVGLPSETIKNAAIRIKELENENAELRAVAVKLIANNGGPLQSEEQVERDSVDDYIMIKLQDFEALCAAIDTAKKRRVTTLLCASIYPKEERQHKHMTDTPHTQKVQVVNLGKPWHHAYKELYSHACEQEREIAKLREALKEISTTAHCIAKAGPLTTPTLQDAWGKFMAIDAMATKALSK